MMEEVYIDNPSIQLLNINGKVDCEPVPTGYRCYYQVSMA